MGDQDTVLTDSGGRCRPGHVDARDSRWGRPDWTGLVVRKGLSAQAHAAFSQRFVKVRSASL